MNYGIYDPVWERWYCKANSELWYTSSDAVAHAQLAVVQTFPVLSIHKANPPRWQVVCIEKWHREREGERLRREAAISHMAMQLAQPVYLEEGAEDGTKN